MGSSCCGGELPVAPRSNRGGRGVTSPKSEEDGLILSPWGQRHGKKTASCFPFKCSSNESTRIDGIRIMGTPNRIHYIQVRRDGRWLSNYGGSKGSQGLIMNEILLDDTEYVQFLTTKFNHDNNILTHFKMETNYGSVIESWSSYMSAKNKDSRSKRSDIEVKTEPSTEDHKLVNIRGSYDGTGILQIQCKWDISTAYAITTPQWSRPYGLICNSDNSRVFHQMGVYDDISKELTGVRLYGKKIVKAIEFQINDEWSDRHGCIDNLGCVTQQLKLRTDRNEFICKVEFNYNDAKSCFEFLQFTTNMKKSISMGMGDLGSKRIDIVEKGPSKGTKKSVLVDVRGGANSQYVTGLQFLWENNDSFDD